MSDRPLLLRAAFCLALAVVFHLLPQPALATRLPPDLQEVIRAEFPDTKIRLDGSVETARGELFLALMPQNQPKKHGKAQLQTMFPNAERPDVLVYGNGWCFLHVIKRGRARTVSLPAEMPEKLRKEILSCKFPSDLIVPEGFFLPQSFKPLIGDVAIQTVSDATIASPEFGRSVGLPGAGHAANSGSVFLTSLATGTITLLDDQTLSKMADFHTEGTPCSMAWAANRLYITDQAKNRVLILDPVRRQILGQIDLPAHSAPKGIAALPNGKLMYVAESGSDDVAVIETASNRLLLRTRVPAGPGRVTVTPNGNFLIVLNSGCDQVTFISTLNQKVVGTVKVGQVPTTAVVASDNRTAYVSNRLSNTVSVLDIPERKVTGTIATGTGPTGLSLSKDDTRLYVANAKDNTIGVYDTRTRQKLSEIRLPMDVDFPYSIDLMPDGKRLLVSSESTDTIASLDLGKMEFDKHSMIGHNSHDIIWVPVR